MGAYEAGRASSATGYLPQEEEEAGFSFAVGQGSVKQEVIPARLAQEEITRWEGAGRLFWPRVYAQVYLVSSQRAKPDLAIWAHQARQTSGQALEAFRRGKLKPAHSSHLPHSTLYSDYVSCSRAHSALEYRTFGPSRL